MSAVILPLHSPLGPFVLRIEIPPTAEKLRRSFIACEIFDFLSALFKGRQEKQGIQTIHHRGATKLGDYGVGSDPVQFANRTDSNSTKFAKGHSSCETVFISIAGGLGYEKNCTR